MSSDILKVENKKCYICQKKVGRTGWGVDLGRNALYHYACLYLKKRRENRDKLKIYKGV